MIKTDRDSTITIKNLRKRAEIIAQIRQFFAARNILEVETPLLSKYTVTDVHLHSIQASCSNIGTMYLQTSPEYAMKRMLAAGVGSIYQICKSFRDGECGRYHNQEFTMLEWYRLGFTHHDLMNEMDELLQFILEGSPAVRRTYQEIFMQHLNINPHLATVVELQQCAVDNDINSISAVTTEDRDTWLQLLMSEYIEPKLAAEEVVFIYDYPATQAALAKIRQEPQFAVAERFEVYVRGIELANGFHELTDATEQRQRFLQDLATRRQLGYATVAIDEPFLASLATGLPACAGVALGVDRLVMLALHESEINNVIWM
jgi:lysyl-tRNA synthetase class 2